jgi:hypothetical protein
MFSDKLLYHAITVGYHVNKKYSENLASQLLMGSGG